MPTPESAPGSVLAANLIMTIQDDDRSNRSNSPSPSTNESMPRGDVHLNEDTGENTALLVSRRPVKKAVYACEASSVVPYLPTCCFWALLLTSKVWSRGVETAQCQMV